MQLVGFKRQLFIQLGITVGIIIVFSLFIFFLNVDINGRIEQINTYKNNLFLREKTIEILSTTHGELDEATAAMSILDNILPSRDSLVGLPRELERLGRDRNITVGFGFENETAATGDEPGKITFNMSLLAPTMDSIAGFLSDLEKHRYFIVIESVDINPQENSLFQVLMRGIVFTK